MKTLFQSLIFKDGLTPDEASDAIDEMKLRVKNGEDPKEVLYESGLESEYVFDIIYEPKPIKS